MDQLRQENEEFRKELFRARDDRDEWKRRAEAAEAKLQHISMASGLMRIDTPPMVLKKALVASEMRVADLERQLAEARTSSDILLGRMAATIKRLRERWRVSRKQAAAREDTLSTLHRFVVDNYGERCPDYMSHCLVCESWRLVDDFAKWYAARAKGGAK